MILGSALFYLHRWCLTPPWMYKIGLSIDKGVLLIGNFPLLLLIIIITFLFKLIFVLRVGDNGGRLSDFTQDSTE